MRLGIGISQQFLLVGTGDWDAHIKFKTDLNSINDILSVIRFIPDRGFNSWSASSVAAVEIVVFDSKSARASSRIDLAVTPKNKPPVMKFPGEIWKLVNESGIFFHVLVL